MNINLTQRQRVLVGIVYFFILVFLYQCTGGGFNGLLWSTQVDCSIWFYSGAFLVVLGAYITEPFFTRPADAIANSTAVLITLLSLSNKHTLFGYAFLLYYSLIVLSSSIFAIFLKDGVSSFSKIMGKIFYFLATNFGASKVIFSWIYLFSAYSYYGNQNKVIPFICIIAYWICLVFFDVVGLVVNRLEKLILFFSSDVKNELGKAIGCENPLLYNVEIDYTKHKLSEIAYGNIIAIETGTNVGSVGIIVNIKYLLNKRWVGIYLLQNNDNEIIKIDLGKKKLITDGNTIYSGRNAAYLLDINGLDDKSKAQITSSNLYKNRSNFIGYVTHGSNINTIHFFIFRDFEQDEQKISEGSILRTFIYDQETLYQVLDGNTKEERLENFDKYGYTIGIARKLGKYISEKKELTVNKWMPQIYAPLFFLHSAEISEARKDEIAQGSIGRLPETDLEIPIKNPAELITHNTAILGILGIGKSCLTFELIKKISGMNTKVVCIDITNEYEGELVDYNCGAVRINDAQLKTNLQQNYTKINKDVAKGGNHGDFKRDLKQIFEGFINGTDKILIVNPEEYDVSEQTTDVKPKKIGPGPNDWQDQAPMRDLTIVEITRTISEVILEICKGKGKTKEARCLMIFEEAHSLVPEWNAVANRADEKAINGTAKVILQGRKYGLGIFLITQRTANVSKSILNQCNTIFALRVFDDTGKLFLENYIGKDYANTLPTLEERHAIAIGRGLKLKQPVIIRLNERKNLIGKD